MRVQHSRQPPDIAGLLSVLDRHAVRYVLVGSVAALAYGAEIGEPGDLDITPAWTGRISPDCARFSTISWPAPKRTPRSATGSRARMVSGDGSWMRPTPELLAQRANWRPDPGDPRTFDTLLCSRLGSFDIVPELGGTYDTLMKRAVRLRVWEHDLWSSIWTSCWRR